MTDEKLEKILQQTLIPEVADEDIYLYRKVRKSRKKFVKIFAAVAACLALILGINASGTFTIGTDKDTDQTVAENSPFVITCYAKELEKGVSVPLKFAGYDKNGYVINGGEDGESVAYNTGMRFKCEGDNIATVTYSINGAAFWICEKHGNSIITDCTEYTGEYFNAGGFAPKGCKEDETDEENYDIRELSSYTLAYDKQESDTSIFAIKGIKKNKKIYELFESDFVDDNVEGITKLTDDVVITCTVTYNDGTSESKEIGLKGIKETIKDDGEQPCEVADFACELK